MGTPCPCPCSLVSCPFQHLKKETTEDLIKIQDEYLKIHISKWSQIVYHHIVSVRGQSQELAPVYTQLTQPAKPDTSLSQKTSFVTKPKLTRERTHSSTQKENSKQFLLEVTEKNPHQSKSILKKNSYTQCPTSYFLPFDSLCKVSVILKSSQY